MNCPVCGNGMEQGLLQGGQRIAWVKSRHLVSLHPKEGEVLLGNKMWSDLAFEAYICKTCKKIVVDYSSAEYQEG